MTPTFVDEKRERTRGPYLDYENRDFGLCGLKHHETKSTILDPIL